MNSNESTAYAKGLFEGLDIDRNSREGKLFFAMLDTIEKLAAEVTELQAKVKDLGEYVEEIDDDLSAAEEILYDEDDDYDYDDDEDDDDEDEGEDTQYYEVVCPSCGETVCFDDSLTGDTLNCPSCGEKLELEFECDGNCEGNTDCPCKTEE